MYSPPREAYPADKTYSPGPFFMRNCFSEVIKKKQAKANSQRETEKLSI